MVLFLYIIGCIAVFIRLYSCFISLISNKLTLFCKPMIKPVFYSLCYRCIFAVIFVFLAVRSVFACKYIIIHNRMDFFVIFVAWLCIRY